jgi:integrase
VYNELVFLVNEKLKEQQTTGSTLYRQLLPRFYQSLVDRDLTAKTVENYTLCIEAHTLKLWGHRPIDSITVDEIRKLIKVTLADRSPSHQKSMLKIVRAVFNYASETGALQRSPVPFMQFRIGDKIKKVLTEQQLKIFLEKAKQYEHEWYPIWVTAVYTGCRNGELHALTWDKVDLDNRKILVSCTWNKKDGYKDLTKSEEDRIVEIAPTLLIVLKELKLQNLNGVYVLPRIVEWDDGRQAELLRMFLVGINLPQVRFHDLRASWATVMLGKGIEPVKVMSMGGWRDLKTMMIYFRKAGINIKGITDKLELHNPSRETGQVLELRGPKESV